MLSLSRLESGQELFRHTPMVIEPLLRARVASYRDKAVMKNVGLELELHKLPDQLKVLAADEAIRQILDNLIDNAVKYTPAGGRVEVHAGLYSNEWLEIFVTDTGMGIPRSDLSRIFERFYRVDKAEPRPGRNRAWAGHCETYCKQSWWGSRSGEPRRHRLTVSVHPARGRRKSQTSSG